MAAVYQGAPLTTGRHSPVGSGHSTLIKVSSIRSGGIGNRSITRGPLGIVHPLGSGFPCSHIPYLQTSFPHRYSSIFLESATPSPSIRRRASVACVQRPFPSQRRGSVAGYNSPPPPFPTIPAWWLSGIPKGMTRVRVVIHRLVEEGGTTRFCRFSGNRGAHESCSFAHRGGVVINRRERERKSIRFLSSMLIRFRKKKCARSFKIVERSL